MQIEKVNPRRAKKKAGRAGETVPRAPVDEDAEADRLRAKLKALGPEVEDFARILAVVNMYRMWADCPHPACRRARTCRGDDMVCFWERRPLLKRKILHDVAGLLCTANVSAGEFYDYLDEVAADADENDEGPQP